MKVIKVRIGRYCGDLPLAGPVSANRFVSNTIGRSLPHRRGDNVARENRFEEPLAAPPTGFSVAKPARMAFDFPSTNGLVCRDQRDLQRRRPAETPTSSGWRPRVVLNLTRE